MADDEEEEEEEEQPKGVKQIVKGGTKRVPYCGYPIYYPTPFEYFPLVGLSCKTPGSALPTRIFQCMKPKKSEMPCAPQGATSPAQMGAGDQYPPQGGTLKQTCGVKAQFLGEIIIKKEIPPKESGEEPCPSPPPEESRTPPCPSPCPSPCPQTPREIPEWNEYECLRNMAPMCGPIVFPLQPEIPDDCRRKLEEFGPDSSRPHPCGPAEEHVVCPHPCGHPAQDVLPYGHADSYETVRTREEIVVDSMDPCLNPCPEKKYVKVEDTFRRTRSYNPGMDGYPPPITCGYPCGPCGPCAPCGPYGPCGQCGTCGPCGPCTPCGPCGPCSTTCDPCNPCRPCSPCGSPCCSPCGPCGSSCSCGPCGNPCCNPCGPCPPCGGSCGPCYQPCPPPRAPSPSHCPAACTPQKLYDEQISSPYGCLEEYEPPKCPPPCDDPFVKAREEEKQDILFKRSPICPCDNTCKTPCRGTPCG